MQICICNTLGVSLVGIESRSYIYVMYFPNKHYNFEHNSFIPQRHVHMHNENDIR